MSDPKIDAVGSRNAPEIAPETGERARGRMREAAAALRASGDDVSGAQQLLRKGERLLPTLSPQDAAATRAAMGELRDALPASLRDGSLRLDEDIAVVPGELEPAHFHAIEGVAMGAHAVELGVHAAEAVLGGVSATVHVLGSACGALAIGLSAYQIIEDFATAESDGARDGLLHAAFGGLGTSGPAWSAGIGAALRGLNDGDRLALRDQIDSSHRHHFDLAYRRAMEAQAQQPEAFAEAKEQYGRAFRAYSDGLAAGTQGWEDSSRGPAFQRGRADARRRLSAPGGNALRVASRQTKLEGFEAAMNDEVDQYRYQNDPHYRSGVSHFRRVGAQGPDALARELSRLDLTSALTARHARIDG